MVVVPRVINGGTVVCIAGGPSLTADDVNYCRSKADLVVAVNDAYRLAPWADALYACDYNWWNAHKGVPSYEGPKYSLAPHPKPTTHRPAYPDLKLLKNTGESGIERDPSGLKTGRNSGYQAINLAVHLGASRIVLLGYDMQRDPRGKTHWFGKHPKPLHEPLMKPWIPLFATLVKPLAVLGIRVINCSPSTALNCFSRQPLRDALHEKAA